MKKVIALSVAVLAVSVTANLMALQVTTTGNGGQAGNGYGPYQTSDGGEFTLQVDNVSVLNNGYVEGVTKNVLGLNNTFQTFCVETGEYIWPNTTCTTTQGQETLLTDHLLTQGAAYLYGKFATGTLAGYDYTRAGSRPDTWALQQALWYFMGEWGNPGNSYVTMGLANGGFALNQLGSGQLEYGVAVLNLWSIPDGAQRQDQLILTGGGNRNLVPDGGMTVSLLGMALGSLALVSRKLRK